MRVGVGSGNPVKRRAVEAVLDAGEDTFGEAAVVEAVPVDSGVSEQPRGHGETVAGAETRARNVLAAGAYDLGVGIEGGVAQLDAAPGLFLVMWAAVTDGDRLERGSGPALRLPETVAGRVRDGAELGPSWTTPSGSRGWRGAAGRGARSRAGESTAPRHCRPPSRAPSDRLRRSCTDPQRR